jgi:hypothetical protein
MSMWGFEGAASALHASQRADMGRAGGRGAAGRGVVAADAGRRGAYAAGVRWLKVSPATERSTRRTAAAPSADERPRRGAARYAESTAADLALALSCDVHSGRLGGGVAASHVRNRHERSRASGTGGAGVCGAWSVPAEADTHGRAAQRVRSSGTLPADAEGACAAARGDAAVAARGDEAAE